MDINQTQYLKTKKHKAKWVTFKHYKMGHKLTRWLKIPVLTMVLVSTCAVVTPDSVWLDLPIFLSPGDKKILGLDWKDWKDKTARAPWAFLLAPDGTVALAFFGEIRILILLQLQWHDSRRYNKLTLEKLAPGLNTQPDAEKNEHFGEKRLVILL